MHACARGWTGSKHAFTGFAEGVCDLGLLVCDYTITLDALTRTSTRSAAAGLQHVICCPGAAADSSHSWQIAA